MRQLILLLGLALSFPLVADGWFTARAPVGLPATKSIVDIHTHVAGIGQGCEGCFVSPSMRDSYKFAWYLRAFGTNEEEMTELGDGVVAERLAAVIRSSRWVRQSVLLALDGVIKDNGELDRELTQVYVPNSYVREVAARYEEFLYGASINPYRIDAIKRLRTAKAAGAVLIKWIPSIMAIDVSDETLAGFYTTLRELDLPLLVHVGDENAFDHADNRLGDPHRLAYPLSLGVKVIAAHLATTGSNGGEDNFDRLLPMFAEHPNLVAEISSLTQVNKLGYLKRALEQPNLHHRLLHGSDWPLQFFPLVWAHWHIGSAPWRELRYAAALDNPLDRDIAIKAALGVPVSVFLRTAEYLGVAP